MWLAIGPDKQARTEPVAGTIRLSSTVQRLRLFPLQSDGSRGTDIPLEPRDGTYIIILPTDKQTHWFVLEEFDSVKQTATSWELESSLHPRGQPKRTPDR
jgi:hypothetical protein